VLVVIVAGGCRLRRAEPSLALLKHGRPLLHLLFQFGAVFLFTLAPRRLGDAAGGQVGELSAVETQAAAQWA
jgi:hypothetical protein